MIQDSDSASFSLFFRKECNVTDPRGDAGGRDGGGSRGEKTQVIKSGTNEL